MLKGSVFSFALIFLKILIEQQIYKQKDNHKQSIISYIFQSSSMDKYINLTLFWSYLINGIENLFESVGIITITYYMNSKVHSALAIPFITYNEGKGFSLSEEAQQFLGSLSEERQLGIVSIVGKYRTGKSFFVNRVMLNQRKNGFQVGPTINPCTKGLWLWKKTIQSQTNQNMDIIIIDTEGFGGMDQNANHDSRIFLFSLLLSSFFIYNSVGNIDENALNTLNLIINLAKDIQTKATSKPEDNEAGAFPAFLWVVRDFALMLQDKNGNKINSKEYLENALQFQKGSSESIENKNKIRRHFKHFFTNRDCELMVRPTEREKDLQRLDELDNSMLRPEFVSQVEHIRNKIFTKTKPKMLSNKALNGRLLICLIKGYMETINKGHLPNVESAWFYVCRNEGLKAIREATNYMEDLIEEMAKKPIGSQQIESNKQKLKKQVMQKFKKRSLGSQESHPDIIDKLQKKMEEQINQLIKKNRYNWEEIYKNQAESLIQNVKEKIYMEQYNEFSEFIKDLENVKENFDKQTKDGDSIEKWKFFNELSQNLYRLAGETITNKMNKNIIHQKEFMQKKIQLQTEQIEEKNKVYQDQRGTLKHKIQHLERQNAKLLALEQTHKNRANQYKNEHDKVYEKYKNLYNEHQQALFQLQKLKKQSKKCAQNQMEEVKSEVNLVKSTLQRQRTLFQMQKKYIQEEVDRYKQRIEHLEGDSRKQRTNNARMTADFEQMTRKYEERQQEMQVLNQSNTTYSKRIEQLMSQNYKKNQIVSDHSEWMLEKSYLENQISFLKNTLNENKRLHDALLVALQQSLSSSEGQNNQELIEANKNLASSMEKIQARNRILEQKYEKIKEYKKMMKSCLSMQCVNCNKWIQTNFFSNHIQQCFGSILSPKNNISQLNIKQAMHITVTQNVVKQSQDRKKPFTEYIIQISFGEMKWKVSKKYKEFTELQHMLINKYPSIKYPPSCNFLADINNLVKTQKNMVAEERRKSLQQYMRDLSKMEEIRNSEIFKSFLQIKEKNTETKKHNKNFSQKKEIMC